MPSKHHKQVLPRFIIVGISCTLICFAINFFLQAQLHLSPFFASLAAYGFAFGVAYVLQKTWAFRSSLEHRVSLPRYASLQLGCAVFTATLTQFLSHASNAISPFYLSLFATGLASTVSYSLSLSWVFADKQHKVKDREI